MLEVLGKTSSINVRKVLWTCAELGLPFEQTEWGTDERPADMPAFLALNPNAQVPVIRDDSFVLWESNAICRYLVGRYGQGSGLLPDEPKAAARVEQWMGWQSTDLNGAWRYAVMALVRHSPAFRDADQIAASAREWNRHMGILDARLSTTGAFVTGADFTLADILLGLSANRWLKTPIERPPLTAVAAYADRLARRPTASGLFDWV